MTSLVGSGAIMASGGPPGSEKPVTCTRFVLPFGYKLKLITEHGPSYYPGEIHFRKREFYKEELARERRKYFTMETGKVLFDRTALFTVNTDVDRSLSWNNCAWAQGVDLVIKQGNNKRRVTAALLPPQVLLFEWPSVDMKAPEKHHSPIFHTGFLLLDLYFPNPADHASTPVLDDLLYINDLLRYTDPPYDYAKECLQEMVSNAPSFLTPFNISKTDEAGNALHSFAKWAELLALPVVTDGGEVCRLVPENFVADSCSAFKKDKIPDHLADYLIYADNRAYVWSTALVSPGEKSLKSIFEIKEEEDEKSPGIHNSGHWHRFLNVDSPAPIWQNVSEANKKLSSYEKAWAKNRTYTRWAHENTFYGFSYHSGVMLAVAPEDGASLRPDRHFATFYFDIVILLFYLRITLFRFSRQLTEITAAKRDGKMSERQWQNEFKKLRGLFSEFTILYQFPLLSNQQQAVEMYAMARTWFDVDQFYGEIKGEIDSTHEYLSMVKAEDLSSSSMKIAKLGVPLAVIAVLTGLLDMDPLISDKCWVSPFLCNLNGNLVNQSIIIVLAGYIISLWLNEILKKK